MFVSNVFVIIVDKLLFEDKVKVSLINEMKLWHINNQS